MVLTLSVIAAEPNRLIILPFGILLLAIAFGPLIAQHHWDRHYHKLCIVLAGVVCLYHLFVIFLGIFGTMIPVLEYMERSAGKLGLSSDLAFYWGTGLLSGLLDNAPTFLAFFAAALGRHGLDIYDSSHISRFISENGRELIAISLGATFLAR